MKKLGKLGVRQPTTVPAAASAAPIQPAKHSRPNGGVLLAWVPGWSPGKEACFLAMVFKEALAQGKRARNFMLQVFATDLDKEAIDKAREGDYPANIAAVVSPKRLSRFFVQDDRGYRVNKEICELAILAPRNLVADPPFTKLDFLTCRNLLIYLGADLQKKLLSRFHCSLNRASPRLRSLRRNCAPPKPGCARCSRLSGERVGSRDCAGGEAVELLRLHQDAIHHILAKKK